MKLSFLSDEEFKIYINKEYLNIALEDEKELYESLKKILLNMRKRYSYNIYGFYEVNIYRINELGYLFIFTKKEDSFLCKTIELKIVKNNSEDVYFEFENYEEIFKNKKVKFYNNKFYINVEDVNGDILYRLSEYFEIIIDDRLKYISNI